eukprot:6173652-Pleurochrysis_carterae.AAC.17
MHGTDEVKERLAVISIAVQNECSPSRQPAVERKILITNRYRNTEITSQAPCIVRSHLASVYVLIEVQGFCAALQRRSFNNSHWRTPPLFPFILKCKLSLKPFLCLLLEGFFIPFTPEVVAVLGSFRHRPPNNILYFKFEEVTATTSLLLGGGGLVEPQCWPRGVVQYNA